MITVNQKRTEADLQLAEFRLFQELMYKHAGISLSEKKHSLVQNRLRKRLRVLKLRRYRDYYDFIVDKRNASEFQECLNALTTNETYFFRHKHHWDQIVHGILPTWRQTNRQGSTFRAWSAASSTGEEPYSLAILLRDCLPAQDGWRIAVDATDINEEVIRQAENGMYSEYALQKLTPLCLERYFRPAAEGKHQVVSAIRSLVQYRLHNLQTPTTGFQYDLIFVRNVMIYFDEASKARVLGNLVSRLKKGGYLFLGGAETLSACQNQFTQICPTIYRKTTA